MAINDPIADMLTRIRNATRNKAKTVNCSTARCAAASPTSCATRATSTGYDVIEDGRQGQIRVKLKYGPAGESSSTPSPRMSKPGRRVYAASRSSPSRCRAWASRSSPPARA
jgi:small subunit ribosomal protein S8